MSDDLIERACEVVNHKDDCEALDKNGDKDCTCDAVAFLRDLRIALAHSEPYRPKKTSCGLSDVILGIPAIKARAEAATPVRWFRSYQRGSAYEVRGEPGTRYICEHATEADAAHIAGMDPPTTLALVAEVQRMTHERDEARAEADRLSGLINMPHTDDWLSAVKLEAAYQRERYAPEHDASKTPFDWFWLIGYLAQKAASAQVAGDETKARHHTISTGAALLNWFRHIERDERQSAESRPRIGRVDAAVDAVMRRHKGLATLDLRDPADAARRVVLTVFEAMQDRHAFAETVPGALEIETAVGGSYVLPDGRKFWIDGPVAREITRRVCAIRSRASTPAGHDKTEV